VREKKTKGEDIDGKEASEANAQRTFYVGGEKKFREVWGPAQYHTGNGGSSKKK